MSEEGEPRDVKDLLSVEDTRKVPIPRDPLARVIGQDEAVGISRLAAKQRRHLLLVGPPGTGKSMIAQALALYLPSPTEEIQVVHNPENPERPFVEVRQLDETLLERKEREGAAGELVDPRNVPIKVAEQLGYKCLNCGTYSGPSDRSCPKCEKPKGNRPALGGPNQPFGDLLGNVIEVTVNQLGGGGGRDRLKTTRMMDGKEEVVVYERAGDSVRVLDEEALERRRALEKQSPRKVLVKIDRDPFVLATGASEVELLGDVRHDPYGGHAQLGTPPYERVVAGAIHEAHQGVLFIDELPLLGPLQRFILTAMQEKRFHISGRHPQSAGASVKVEDVPCDFIFVGACNIQDLQQILSPLRSRIIGSGYEVLVETTMPDTEENRALMVQFTAQEVQMDGRIPHVTSKAVEAIIQESRRRAKLLDNKDGVLTLRLREMGGLIRVAGDLARSEGAELTDHDHIRKALKRAMPVEEQIKERYGSYYAAMGRDVTAAQRETAPYNYWEKHVNDDRRGYE